MAGTVLKTNLADWGDWYRKLGGRTHGTRSRLFIAVRRGLIRAGHRAVGELQRATSAAGPANPNGTGTGGAVNTGNFKRSWKNTPMTDGALVHNTAAYGGVIEGGRRTGRFPPMNAIRDWAQRRLGLSREEAARAAFPIARAIAKRGLMARKVMASTLPAIEKFLAGEIEAELQRELTGGGA